MKKSFYEFSRGKYSPLLLLLVNKHVKNRRSADKLGMECAVRLYDPLSSPIYTRDNAILFEN